MLGLLDYDGGKGQLTQAERRFGKSWGWSYFIGRMQG